MPFGLTFARENSECRIAVQRCGAGVVNLGLERCSMALGLSHPCIPVRPLALVK
jgi:hypothetical protein